MLQAPEAVLSSRVSNALCVMFFGFPKNGKQRDYGWVKQGMIYPFKQFLERFRGQTQLFMSKPSELQMAIEEAVLAENGFIYAAGKTTNSQANPLKSNIRQEAFQKDTRPCGCCGLITPCKSRKKMKGSDLEIQVLCKRCVKLKKLKQYCGICKKIWHHSDGGDWVCCDGCNVCGCMLSVTKFPVNFSRTWSTSITIVLIARKSPSVSKNPGIEVTVVCNGMEGTYVQNLHMVVCQCGFCAESKMWKLDKWARHAGYKSKIWKDHVKVKATMLPLKQWIADYNEHGVQPLKLDKQRLLGYLQEKYEPDNKMIICNRCQIAVHQECYGAKGVQDFTSWVCRACETPDVIRECCLCPVKGGALKPTDVDTLWVHVSCAWFRPEVGFLNPEKMEPASGILRIPPTFLKRCVICMQTHGSCTTCCKCATHFHATCASRAGYSMELHCLEKKGKQVTTKLIYCAVHRTPNPDAAVVVHTGSGVFASKPKGVLYGVRVEYLDKVESLKMGNIGSRGEECGSGSCQIGRVRPQNDFVLFQC
ncbi:hypothetical protein M0R45_034162 [Rubus argutus]|uniref:PHD-type domain-containing protein n=1 Tax=Rubus argutus TaxID=59490 RepID=A0AAW1VSX8_RUBAR